MENPLVRKIVGIPKPSSLCEDSIAAEHLERVSDELFNEETSDY